MISLRMIRKEKSLSDSWLRRVLLHMLHTDSSDGLDCDICYQKYDLTAHLPRVLPHCGHTLCSKCIDNIKGSSYKRVFTCPFDKKEVSFQANSFNQFPPNFQLKTLIEARLSQVYCPEHQKPLDYICLTHDLRICGDCALVGDHKDPKGHQIKAINEVEPLFLEKKAYLESIKEDIWSYNPSIENLKSFVEQQKKEARSVIVLNFKRIREYILDAEKKQLKDLERLFEEQVRDPEEIKKEHQELKREIEEKMSKSHRFNQRQGLVKFIEEEIWQFSAKFEAFKKTFLGSTYEDFFKKLLKMLRGFGETDLIGIWKLKMMNDDKYKELLEAKKSCFEQAKSHLLEDFKEISKSLGLDSKGFRDIEALQSLKEITFSSSKILGQDELPSLKRVRNSLKNIEKIYICFNHSPNANINKQKLHDLIQILFWKPFNITTVSLDFPSPAVSSETLNFLASKIFTRTFNLQNLRVIFHRNEFTSQSLANFLKSLAPISNNLTSLELDFSRLPNFGAQAFPWVGLSMPKLKNFSINFANTTFANNELAVFVKETLGSLDEVEIFEMNLYNTKVSEKGGVGLLRGVLKALFKCRELILEFPKNCVQEKTLSAYKALCKVELKEKLVKVSVKQ